MAQLSPEYLEQVAKTVASATMSGPGAAPTAPDLAEPMWRSNMADGTCLVDDCGNPVWSRGICNKHYKRWQAHGDVPILPRKTPESRLLAMTAKTDGCWLWTGYVTVDGYGIIRVGGRAQGAHRLAYELYVGPIPAGLEIDHLCQTRNCVNPEHLEPVTREENARRAGERQTHCASGHEYTVDNTHRRGSDGARICLACQRGGRADHRKGVRGGRAVA